MTDSDLSTDEILGMTTTQQTTPTAPQPLQASYYIPSQQPLHLKNYEGPDAPTNNPPFTPLIDVPAEDHHRISRMLDTHEEMWNGKLGWFKGVQHRIDLKPGARNFSFDRYRAGPTQRQLEAEEVKKKLDQGVIDPAASEWGSPVLFVQKRI